MKRDPVAVLLGVALLACFAAAVALATVPPVEQGQWAKLTVCTLTGPGKAHREALDRLGVDSEIWVRKVAVIGIQDKPGRPGCSTISGASGKTFLVEGTADALVGVLQ